jgi:hypothetical protein
MQVLALKKNWRSNPTETSLQFSLLLFVHGSFDKEDLILIPSAT